MGRRQRDGRPRHRGRVLRARGRTGRTGRHRRGGTAQQPLRPAGTQGLRLRVRVPGPPGQHHLRPFRARGPGRHRAAAGDRTPRGRRPGHPGPGVRHPRGGGLRAGVGHPLRPGPRQELLRRPDVHPAFPDHPAAGHQAQAEPAARRHPGQAPRGGRRLDRAGQHAARAGAHVARGRRRRGARQDRLPAGPLALLLRHRLRLPGRADRERDRRGRDSPVHRSRLARLRLTGRADRRVRAAQDQVVRRVLRRRLPDPAAGRPHDRQVSARGS